jgi:hypothetical protein
MAFIGLPALSEKVGVASLAIKHHALTPQPFAFFGTLVW